ncbi:hypothetical protein V8C37DRAFT_242981 [Trichoderma ceciliae]
MEQQHIDSLLERYLTLIDEYSRLREELSKLQAGVYQNIARANFTGERGMRYGQDHYDERMRALRVLDIRLGEEDVPNFTMKSLTPPLADDVTGDDEGRKEEDEKRESSLEEEKVNATTAEEKSTDSAEGQEKDEEKRDKKKKSSNNPLHWFGLLTPPPLRNAQTLSIQAVEQVMPRLISVNAEMEHVEIEIRRARKKRAKATAVQAAEKEALRTEAVEAR